MESPEQGHLEATRMVQELLKDAIAAAPQKAEVANVVEVFKTLTELINQTTEIPTMRSFQTLLLNSAVALILNPWDMDKRFMAACCCLYRDAGLDKLSPTKRELVKSLWVEVMK